jgi:Raf kinase inhibitor-like YbhB/YbcL family protein
MVCPRTPVSVVLAILAALALGGGCRGGTDGTSEMGDAMKLELHSSAFGILEVIPKRHTGDGKDVSPPLAWFNVPDGTRELALVMDDPDAPRDEPWVHWILYKIPPSARGLPEAVPATESLDNPPGALQGNNTWPAIGYRGPAPPKGHGTHHYHFKLYALDAELDAKAGLDKTELLKAIKGHVLATAELIGTYER